MDSLSTGRQNGEALSPFYNFPYNFYGTAEPASKTAALNCCRDPNREAESSPGDARPRIGFAAGPGDLAGAHSPGAGRRRRRPGWGRHPREDGGRERRAPHPLSPHTSGPGGGREGAERGGGAVHPGRWPAGRPLGERGGGCSPWPDGQRRRPHALRNGQKTEFRAWAWSTQDPNARSASPRPHDGGRVISPVPASGSSTA